ncbi:MAG: PolC-type DNA polymerase III [Eubacterium sp.]|nr:PolC-type DNA polymerase III [Eubacterium sp.]
MEVRKIYEVFPDFTFSPTVDKYLRDTMVTRVVMYNEKRLLELFLDSEHLIEKSLIVRAEEEIRLHMFGKDDRYKVKIRERFILSGQYTTEKIAELYMDSLFYELSRENHVGYRLIRKGGWEIRGQELHLTLPDTDLSRSKEKQLRSFFEEIFLTRFGTSISVSFSYVEVIWEKEEEKNEAPGPAAPVKQEEDEEDDFDPELEAMEDAALSSGEVTLRPQKMPEEPKKEEKKPKTFGKGRAKDARSGNRKFDGQPKRRSMVHVEDEDFFYGRNVEGEEIPISSLSRDTLKEFCVRGQVVTMEVRELKSGTFLIIANITDDTDTIAMKLFLSPEDKEPFCEEFKQGGFYKVKGILDYDTFSRDIVINQVIGIKTINNFRKIREDDAEEKRIELHLHTCYSEADSVVGVEAAIARAKKWGHEAIAITDHGVAQAFPVANHCVEKDPDFKVIYGVEGYFVDDLKNLTMNGHGERLDGDQEYVVFDIETTGLSRKACKIIEIGAVRVDARGKELGRFSEFINPEEPIPYEIEQLTSITDRDVMDAPTIEVMLPRFLEFSRGAILVAHNAAFDTGFIEEFCNRLGLPYDFSALDTMTLSYVLLPELGRYNLDRLCKHFGLTNKHHHRACDDADVTAGIFIRLLDMLKEMGITTVEELDKLGHESVSAIQKAKSYHGIILVQNDVGRVNLYRLISEAHIKYFNRHPRIPMSLIQKYREGLILGSACASGELFQALLDGASDAEIARLVSFFDYLEVQPIGNNHFLLEDSKMVQVQTEEDLRDLNRRIIKLGKEFNKPVVATGDVHFLDPEDAAYRTIIQEGSKPKSTKKDQGDSLIPIAEGQSALSNEMLRQPPLYFHTTKEMLKEFDYLDPDLARELVIENPRKIAGWIEKISPVRPDKCPPRIENSDKTLREICESKAHEIYGEELPKIVSDRLNKELDSIIGNGYSVMYIIAQKLVWKSNADGYLVGSRGSVGSSFAATMAGITEVNPLSPHYLCPNCHFVDFDSPEVIAFSGMSGCDMPDRICPNCGRPLKKEGHDIPFETFLGFKGDKEPDIDLNFSGDYQPRAHAYIGEIFGEDYSFRAGTITTFAEKTVFGYVKGFCERRGITMRTAEIERIVQHCLGVKRSTGQHPGGIIVMPDTEEIYSFTPIQRPANDMTADTITTHFDYHSIDHNLLKFDILGHDDPTMIRRLEDLTGLDAKEVPLDDKKVMALFHGLDSLKITPEDIGGTKLGCLGIPEFGTDFAMQMVIDAKPESFSDLVRISGLSHGTDVWLGNAQDLIAQGICKLSSAICCRDDIMVYLMHMGLPSGEAFNIMEKVRKGLVAKGKCDKWPEWKELMRQHNVPEWYIGSCQKIKYMFPKAHAVAYVMMAWRVAYFKVYYPLAYYAAFFSIRAKAFNYEKMCMGRERLDRELKALRSKSKYELSATDQDMIRDMRIVQEMYARGYDFMPIDLYRADDKYFQIIDGKLMPSFSSIEGMGDNAAASLKEAAKDGIFLSKEELKSRAKLSGTTIEKMAELGLLGDMPDTGQLKFDFL